MIVFLTMMVLLIAVASSVGYSIISMTQDTQKINIAQEDKNLLSQWEVVVRNNVKLFKNDSIVAAPFGRDYIVDGTVVYHTMPAGLGVSNINSFGRPLVYCPYSDLSIPNGYSNVASIGSEYEVGIEKDFDGKKYVLYADQSMDQSVIGNGAVAFIISPVSRTGVVPSCKNIKFNSETGRYKVDGGNIKAITKQTLSQVEPTSVTIDAVAGSADLSDLTSSWGATKPSSFTIALDKDRDDYTISNNINFLGSKTASKKVIISGKNGVAFIDSLKATTIEFKDVDVVLNNVAFGDNVFVKVSGGSLSLSSAVMSGMDVSDTAIRFDGEAYFNNPDDSFSNYPLRISESQIFQEKHDVYFEPNKLGGLVLINSKWSSSNAKMIFDTNLENHNAIALLKNSFFITDDVNVSFLSGSNGVLPDDNILYVDETSQINMNKTSINVGDDTSSVILNNGSVFLNGTKINYFSDTNVAVTLGIGSELSLSNSLLGTSSNKSRYGIVDLGANFISGKDSIIHSSIECWHGSIFESTLSSIDGTSLATTDFNKAFNKSIWSCNQ